MWGGVKNFLSRARRVGPSASGDSIEPVRRAWYSALVNARSAHHARIAVLGQDLARNLFFINRLACDARTGKGRGGLPGGRLDSERYEWRLVTAPAAAAQVPVTAAERTARLAEIFFAGAAPATVKDFAGWAGLAQREAQQAVKGLPLVPVQIPGYAEQALAFADDLTAAPPSTEISFLPFEDNYLTAHGGLALLTAPEHHERALPVWGSTRKSPLAQGRQIPLRPILVGPCIVGFWEYDPDKQRVVHATFEKTAARAALSSAAESLTAFLRDELQHGRSFSLDTDDELRTRAEQVLQVSA